MKGSPGARARAIIINEKDNVAVALQDVPAGAPVLLTDGREILVVDEVPASHKIAIRRIPRGEPVIKYGERIGLAGRDIDEGEWVHTHNIASPD